jgi:hypothetical protein
MRKPNKSKLSALFGSFLVAFSPTASIAAQFPAHRPDTPELNWTTLLSRIPPPAPRRFGGSRGEAGEIYAIAPGDVGQVDVWSSRPLFVWHGEIRQIEVMQADTKEMFWSQRLTPDDRYCQYKGKLLEPGQAYEWVIYNLAKSPITQIRFRILPSKERDRITFDLTALETQYAEASAETLALQRAHYFAERQLWAEVLREAFSVKNPSAELAQLRQDLPIQFEQLSIEESL